MKRVFALLVFTFACLIGLIGEPPGAKSAQPKKAVPFHGKGYKPAPANVMKARHAAALRRNGPRIAPKATPASFDCKDAFNNVLPTDDQGQCGDCFGVSSADGCSMALVKAGVLPLAEGSRLSSQYGLDSGAFQGGCDGGDEAQVIEYIHSTGFPLTTDYGPYTGTPAALKNTATMTFYKIGSWGYASANSEQGIASVADMKTAMVTYGPLSVAFDAGECNSYVGGTMTGSGQNVDHAVLCEGWDDNHDNGDGTKGAFIGRNQWGQANAQTVTFQSTPWGITINSVSGRFWIKYGADSWGTEAIWINGGSAVPPVPPMPPPIPPVPPQPVPPGPVPPTPPVPPSPVPVPCTPTFHLFGRPHFRCDGQATMHRQFVFPALHPFRR